MLQLWTCVTGILAVATGVGGAVPGGLTFDDADSIAGWTFHNGPEFPGAGGEIEWNSMEGHGKPGCLSLHYDFSNGGRYVQAHCAMPAGSDVGLVRLRLKKPDAHRLTFRATDSAGQTFQKGLGYRYEGWQAVEVDLRRWDLWFGGAADGKVRFPIARFGVLIENDAEPRQGALLIDDVAWLPRSGEAEVINLTTCVASDFSDLPAWQAGGGTGNRFEKGLWEFSFSGGARPALHSSFSLMGRPKTLRLVVDSEKAGTVVSAAMAGHFAQYERELSTLSGQSGQVIEVPLGDMKTWKRLNDWGGEHVPLPLRMLNLSLQHGQGPAQGRVHLKRLEVDTELPAGLDVVIMPDARIEGDEACFTIRVRNLMESTCEGSLHCRYAGLGEVVGEESQPLRLAGKGGYQIAEFRKPLGGRPFMDAAFQWIGPKGASAAVSVGVAMEPKEQGTTDLDPASPVGMGLYLYRFGGWPQFKEPLTRTAELARRAGIKWTREEFHWARMEPQRGQYDWAFYDAMVDTARENGISVYGLLAYWSAWTKPYTAEGIEDYCRWASQVVRRYKDRIKHWEVWNEPNIGFWTGPKEMYAELLTRAYEAIKSEDPEAVVLGCSTAGIDKDFIRKTMELGGRFDELTIHPYRPRMKEDDFMRELREVRELVGGRRVWITEIGFPTQLLTGVNERTQASLVARTYLSAIGSGAVANICWYDFRNDGFDLFYNEENFGLVRADFRLKPAYRTMATLGGKLAGLKFLEPIDVGPGAFALRFGNDRRSVVAAWSADESRLMKVEMPTSVSITDAMGTTVAAEQPGPERVLTLDAGFPVYLDGPAGFGFKPAGWLQPVQTERNRLHAGESVVVRVDGAAEVVDWGLPDGWSVSPRGSAGEYDLSIPTTASPGSIDLQVIVRQGTRIRVPVALYIQPAVLQV
ncbi:MAG TPA: beta-galactosidase [Phycisphaerae bacterium]|nr:beta-galactosidase [Phycisphaerae bacterium]